MSEIFLIFK